ncbi:hypothetical protein NLX86_26970 [Streptomyces sp. A3M-1-3]|uniref:MauE/DoxX family redox-associated membrane protein n=1 Tax=Streptomyces sp. A3M-1-3 TaxID=2962044 RepID=UPI0020B87B1A|nr:MauE/DoxX family redox-associated membrane protein [Streptomyces sp. A3M-1-3]MCP3821601.1 hypothetical protein [Streptomyces sp. A3M-1-3]
MVLRIVLGALFVAMAAGQLASFSQMPGILAGYGLVAGSGATALAVALIVGELVCGVWFLARPRSRARAPVWVFTSVAVVWALLSAPLPYPPRRGTAGPKDCCPSVPRLSNAHDPDAHGQSEDDAPQHRDVP